MRFLILVLLAIFLSSASFAAESGKHRFKIEGLYGMASVSPKDVNNNFTPDLSSDMFYGGGVGFHLGPKFLFEARYEAHEAKNVNSSGTGPDMVQNEVWGILNYFLVDKGAVHVYLGAGGGYPLYSHFTSYVSNVKTEYDADKTVGVLGQLGIGVMLGSHFSLFFEGGYQSLLSGNVKTTAGVNTNYKLDFSGPRGLGGLAVWF